MRIFIRHTRTGQIVSAVKARILPDGLAQPFGELTEEEGVLEVEPAGELAGLDCHEILDRYTVDVERRQLTARRIESPDVARGPQAQAGPRRRGKGER